MPTRTIHSTGHKGNTKHPLYYRWKSMLNRCYYSKHSDYCYYGGRGISVHPSWLDFNQFIIDVKLPPTLIHQLDRIHTNGNYEPGNTRWVTPSQNTTNSRPRYGRKWKGVYLDKRNNQIFASITVNGKSKFLGNYSTEIEAAIAYNNAAKELYGEFAFLNEVEE